MTDMETTQAAVETSSALERRIEMTVALAEVDKDVEQRLKQMSRTVKMAGFRPGKVPMKMVAQQYGPQARSEAIGAAVERAYGAKVQEQNLRVAGYPRIEQGPTPVPACWASRPFSRCIRMSLWRTSPASRSRSRR